MASSMSENLNLKTLPSQVKSDPDGYKSEITLIYNQFKSSIELFKQQSAMSFTSLSGMILSDSNVSKNLMELVHFLAHVTPFYMKELAAFPNELVLFLELNNLPSDLRMTVARAVFHLVNKKVIDIAETFVPFMKLMTIGGEVKNLASSLVIISISHMNQKHKYDPRIKDIQNILFRMLQQEEETMAKHALTIICELHGKRILVDDRTAEAICLACFHPSSKIMIVALSFLLLEKIEDDDGDDSGSEEDHGATQASQILLSKEAVYKASHKGTVSSKKKKKAKLQRVARSIKKQQRLSSGKNYSSNYSPLNHLKDAQGFAEKLFLRLKTCKESCKTKLMMFKVIARTVSLHQLVLLNFYKSMAQYIKTGERFVSEILAIAVQACHDMVPPDEVEPLFKKVLKEFVHIKSHPKVLSVGLNFVREMCIRMPLLMTDDLLQELVLYRKSNEEAVSSAARSLLTLFREVCPSLLIKKDRGRHADVKTRPKSFGEVDVATNIPGLELLELNDDVSSDDESDNQDDDNISLSDDEERDLTSVNDNDGLSYTDEDGTTAGESDADSEPNSGDSSHGMDVLDDEVSDEDVNYETNDDAGVISHQNENEDNSGKDLVEESCVHTADNSSSNSRAKKRKFSNVDKKSIRALKKLATGNSNVILSDKDFNELEQLKAARSGLKKHGFIFSASDKLITKKFDAAKLEEAYTNKKMTKEQKEALIKAGREETGKYQARTAIKKKKTGGLSNRQKEHGKDMPLAAKRLKIAKTRPKKKLKKLFDQKQFRGRKAWK